MVMQSRNAALRPGSDSLSKPAGRRPKAVPAWRGPRDFHDMQQQTAYGKSAVSGK